ncbi:DUF7657 domain-containing protein [Lactovum odontotermitis]
MRILKQIVKFRYLIGILLLFIGVSLNLNGSSTAIWNERGISVTSSGDSGRKTGQTPSTQEKGIIFGTAREARSDEWMVQTPFYLAQDAAGLPVTNKNYGLSGQNMIVAYNSPVKHLSIIGKPFNWGFLFLSGERAVSFYWCFKIIFMVLLAFEVCMILTKKNLPLSLLGAFWIAFTPLVQWWFMQHLGDIVYFTLAIIVALHYFFETKNKPAKLAFALLLVSSAVGFIFVIYPGFQIPFGYFLLFYAIIKFVTVLRRQKLERYDWLLMALIVLGIAGISAITLKDSWPAISSVLNTVYPGKRMAIGGGFNLVYFTGILSNLLLPFATLPDSLRVINVNELASTLNYLLLILITLPFTLKRDKIKENVLGIYLSVFSLFLIFYASVAGFPKIGQKLSLFSYVEPNRAFQAGITLGVFASIWYVSYLWETRKRQSKSVLYAGIVIQGLFLSYGIFWTIYQFFSKKLLVLILAVYLLTQIFIVLGKKRLFIATMAVMIFLSGVCVNPLNQGLPAIYQKNLAVKIQEIVKTDKNARWLGEGEGYLYQYPQIFGAKMVNSVRFYPDKKLWATLDPQNKDEEEWNRYAHVKVILSTTERDSYRNPQPDQLRLTLNMSELKVLKVKYVVTNRDLTKFLKDAGITAKELYGPDKDGNRIYKITAY